MLFGYTRVSTEEQARDGASSLQHQDRVIRGMAMSRGIGQFDLQIFSDPGVSGAIPLHKRPAGRELMDTAKKGDTIVAAALDRMFRSARDALNVAEILKEREIDLILYNFGVEPVNKSAFAQCFFTMAAAFATLEHATITERTQNGRTAKRARGGLATRFAPYGMQAVGKGREAMLIPHEGEQKFLAILQELKGYPLRRILEEIHERGYRTRKGTLFNRGAIWRLLPEDALCKDAERNSHRPWFRPHLNKKAEDNAAR